MWREFLADVRTQKLRTALTVLGIAWGTVAVVVLLAFGVGLERQTTKRFHGLGDRIVILWGGRTTRAFAGFGDGRPIHLHPEDVQTLAHDVPEIQSISPEYITRSVRLRRGTRAAAAAVTGIDPTYGRMRNIIADQGGRFLNDRDLAERRRVAVLGDELATLLFARDPAVGQRVVLGGTPFLVVGVMRPKLQNSSYSERDKDRVFIPATTHYALFGEHFLNDIVYRARSAEVTKLAERRVYEALGRRYKFDPADKDALAFWDTSEWETRFEKLFVAFHIFFGIVGTFTLLVGGIGVANIMYIVVRERTREIGVRRAVGATRLAILRQFFGEALLIVSLGAALGLLLSVGLVLALGGLPIREFVGAPTISPTVLVATVVLLALVAFAAGLMPARRAAALDPVEALRN